MAVRGMPKGTKITRLSEEVLTKRILTRCLELQEHGLAPTIDNIEPVGCARTTLLRIRDKLILDGFVILPKDHRCQRVRDRIKKHRRYHEYVDVDPDEEEQKSIERRIEEERQHKNSKYNAKPIRVFRSP